MKQDVLLVNVAPPILRSGRGKWFRENGLMLLALLSVYVIWGSTYLAIRFAIEGFAPYQMSGIRFLVAGGVMYLVLRSRGAAHPTRKQWTGGAAIGALLLVGGTGSVALAEQWVASGLAAVWIATMPLWAALFAGLFGRWPRRLEWIGLALGVVGVLLLNRENNLQANPLGVIALTTATICWAFGSVWSRHVSLAPGLMSSATQMLAGGAMLIVLSLLFGEQWRQPSAASIGALLYLMTFGSIIAYSAYGYLLRHVRPALATSYAYVNPIVAVGLGVGLASEPITWAGILALPVILSAVALVALGRNR